MRKNNLNTDAMDVKEEANKIDYGLYEFSEKGIEIIKNR